MSPAATRLVLLGTAAGPFPAAGRQGIASLVLVGEHGSLIDAGYGALRAYVQGGARLCDLQAVLLTHLHSDHVADLFTLFLLGWGPQNDGIAQPVRVIGPGPSAERSPRPGDRHGAGEFGGTAALVDGCLQGFASDIDIRMRTSPRPPLGSLIEVQELSAPPTPASRVVLEDDRVRISAIPVPHPPVDAAYAFRVETADATIVFSGDTAYHEPLGELSAGVDILVHEAMEPDHYRSRGYRPELIDFLMASHTSPADVGRLAEQAAVRTVVLSHLGPPDPHDVSDAQWRAAVARHYRGAVVVGNDLQVVHPRR